MELERIAEEDRVAQATAAPARRFDWLKRGLRRRAAVPRSVRADAGGPPAER